MHRCFWHRHPECKEARANTRASAMKRNLNATCSATAVNAGCRRRQ
ncbi:hypothetical protein COLSTE_00096 [Collinsella stercoris DSM 13279]|uniref:Uncharacterized protein n=1 Tax=Collinsella stercoris DSM 13279 TaxID=445975 RepID=B6G7Q6_9ACTN|nr:hypothetical protein COLSTE_00096 [Collinsella stercoris DSM 13279]